MNGISPRVANGAAAAGSSSPIAIIIIWALGHWVTMPPEIAAALASVISTVSGFVGGYMTKLEAAPPAPPAPGAQP